MNEFLKKFENEINKMISCANGESIVKPFDKIYDEVRDKKNKGRFPELRLIHKKYSEKEESIYKKIIEDFMKEYPELLDKLGEKNE